MFTEISTEFILNHPLLRNLIKGGAVPLLIIRYQGVLLPCNAEEDSQEQVSLSYL